jgi:hypothetical protein
MNGVIGQVGHHMKNKKVSIICYLTGPNKLNRTRKYGAPVSATLRL